MTKRFTEKEQAKRFDEMLKNPANRECFDCTERGPRWASTNLGIFLCLNCAGQHRKLGVHISKVKSINMDKWEPAMVSFIERVGNERALSLYRAKASNYSKPKSGCSSRELERAITDTYVIKRYAVDDLDEQLEMIRLNAPSKPAAHQSRSEDHAGSKRVHSPEQGSWKCNKCTYLSAPTAPSCAMCEAPRAVTADSEWSCTRCTYLNPKGLAQCKMCEAPQAAAAPAPTHAKTHAAPAPVPVPATAPVVAAPAPTPTPIPAPVAAPVAVAPTPPAVQPTQSADLLDLGGLSSSSNDPFAFISAKPTSTAPSAATSSILDAFGAPDVNRGPPPIGGMGMGQGPPGINNGMGQGPPGMNNMGMGQAPPGMAQGPGMGQGPPGMNNGMGGPPPIPGRGPQGMGMQGPGMGMGMGHGPPMGGPPMHMQQNTNNVMNAFGAPPINPGYGQNQNMLFR